MATYQEYAAKLEGVYVPLVLVVPELERLNIYPQDIESAKSEKTFFYKSVGKFVPARPRQFNFFEGGRGVIGFWLKQGFDLSKAKMKVSLLLTCTRAVELYTKVRITHNGNRE